MLSIPLVLIHLKPPKADASELRRATLMAVADLGGGGGGGGGCNLPNAWDRQLLYSAASSPVLNTVRGVATELFFCDVDEVFSPPGSHLCRVCV